MHQQTDLKSEINQQLMHQTQSMNLQGPVFNWSVWANMVKRC